MTINYKELITPILMAMLPILAHAQKENIAKGQRVRKFSLEALVDGKWQTLRDELVGDGDGLTTIGHRRTRKMVSYLANHQVPCSKGACPSL